MRQLIGAELTVSEVHSSEVKYTLSSFNCFPVGRMKTFTMIKIEFHTYMIKKKKKDIL